MLAPKIRNPFYLERTITFPCGHRVTFNAARAGAADGAWISHSRSCPIMQKHAAKQEAKKLELVAKMKVEAAKPKGTPRKGKGKR